MKSLVAAAVVAVALPLSAACGSSADVAKSDPTTTATPTDSTTSAPTTTPPTTADASSRVSGVGYSFAIPAEWEDTTASLKAQNPKLDVAVGQKDASTFRTNFNVVIGSATTATIEKDSVALHKEAAAELRSYTKAAVKPLPNVMIDTEAAIGQTSTFTSSGTSVTFLQYVAVHNGKAYPVTMTFATSNADDAAKTLTGILASWHWTS